MRRSFLLLVLALWTAAPVSGKAAVEPFAVTLKPQIVVEGPVVQLGDLFAGLESRGELASTPVAEAPAAGLTLELSARWLGAVARAYGLGWQPRSQLDRAILERASQTLPAEPIRAALYDALQGRRAGGNVELTLDNPDFDPYKTFTSPASIIVATSSDGAPTAKSPQPSPNMSFHQSLPPNHQGRPTRRKRKSKRRAERRWRQQ